jgi:hypothetical protein
MIILLSILVLLLAGLAIWTRAKARDIEANTLRRGK